MVRIDPRSISVCDGRLTRRQLAQRASLLALGTTILSPTAAPVRAQSTGGRLTIATDVEIDTFDPRQSLLGQPYRSMLTRTCYDALVRFVSSWESEPALAESWAVSEDGLSVTFGLRQDVRFHDGQGLTAEDVEFSLQQFERWPWSSIQKEIAIVDQFTVEVRLDAPRPDLLDAISRVSILPVNFPADIANNPVGTGPFRVVQHVPGDSVTFERNPDYYNPSFPGIDELTFRYLPDTQTAVIALMSGDFDAVLNVPADQLSDAAQQSSVSSVVAFTGGIHTFGFPTAGSLANPELRRAFAYCLDRDAINQVAYAGAAIPKSSFLPVGSPYYDDSFGTGYDLETSKALLSNIGFTERVNLVTSQYAPAQAAGEIWRDGLQNIGVEADVEVVSDTDWYSRYDAVVTGNSSDVIWTSYAGFADPSTFWPNLADRWPSPEAAELVAQANAMWDSEQRRSLYVRLQELFMADLPLLVIAEVPQASLLQPTVLGWEISPLGEVPFERLTVF